jgi:hypothetical protein
MFKLSRPVAPDRFVVLPNRFYLTGVVNAFSLHNTLDTLVYISTVKSQSHKSELRLET